MIKAPSPLQMKCRRSRCATGKTAGRALLAGLAALALFAFDFAPAGLLPAAQAQTIQTPTILAQNQPQPARRRTLFDLLFGNETRQAPVQSAPPVKQQPVQRRAPAVKKKPVISKPKTGTTAAPAAPALPPAPAMLAKNADAQQVLVLGDFIASGLAEGLSETFAQNPDVQIINRTNGSSGFVRQDYYNWTKEFPALIAAQKPVAIVMMIGANDRQPLSQNGTILAPDSESWRKIYQERIDAFLSTAAQSQIPVIWLGQLPYQSSALTQTMLLLNTIYQSAAEKPVSPSAPNPTRASFVDLWGGFVDDQGAFTQTGVDINGQTVRLRGNDGITITAAGKRKLAFYAEKPLRLILRLNQSENASLPPTAAGTADLDAKSNEAMASPVKTAITRLGPVKLSELNPAAEDSLLGETAHITKPAPAITAEQPAPHGRADDFRWPR